LGAAEWLEGDGFSAGDLMMVTVLRRLGGSGLVEEHPNLAAYRRAFADQLAVFTASSGGGSSAGAGGATPA